jgi:CubicO group peptidase (beta-lactamase class C family)
MGAMKRLLLVLFAICANHAWSAGAPVVERLDALLESNFNGGILVAEAGHILYHRAFGENAIDSRFQLASMTKVFTSTAVLQLAAKKRLRLDDPVAKHLPAFPFREITIRHLLAHTSALPDLELYEEMVAQAPGRVIRNSDAVSALIAWKKPLPFAPGTAFRYSNTNYVLLAEVVAKMSGMSYARYLQRFIFAPAGMRDSYVLEDPATPDARRVRNHILPAMYDTQPVDVREVNLRDAVRMRRIRYETVNLGATLGDQNVISTTADVHRFAEALANGKLLPASLMKEATTPARLADGSVHYDEPGPPFATRCSYGLGWETCADMVGHSGYNRGIATMLYTDPARRRTIVMYDNFDGEDFGRKVASVVRILNGEAPLELDRRKAITREYGRALVERGAAEALIAYNRMRGDPTHYTSGSQRALNILGYDLLRNGYTKEALEPFLLNVIFHPEDANAYDSYAEALAANGRTADAIAMYERSLALNPANEAGRRALEKLRASV